MWPLLLLFWTSGYVGPGFQSNSGSFSRGGSRISRRRGRQPFGGGRQHTNLPDFPKNCMKLRTFWSVGGAPGAPPWIRHCLVGFFILHSTFHATAASGGSKGATPTAQIFFQFHAVFGKFWQNRMLGALEGRHPSYRESWIAVVC